MSEAVRVISGVFNFTAGYFVTLLTRCALVSLPILGLVMLLRATVFRNRVFLKGAVWLLFLIVPFFGKLKLYYEVWPIGVPFAYCQEFPTKYPLFRWGYLIVACALVVFLIIRRRKTKRLLWYTTRSFISGEEVYVTDAPVSPFVIGLFRPRIIVPRTMLRELSDTELEMIVLHEKTHIRLLHLWVFLLWDIFAAVYWINPLLFAVSGKLREDMEQICDCVVMQRSGRNAQDYGGLLLKSMGLLQEEAVRAEVMFLGGGGYQRTKRRIERIADFRIYQKRAAICLLTVNFAVVVLMILAVLANSWPKYVILPDITIADEKGNAYADGEEAEKAGAIIREGDSLIVDSEKLRAFLPEDFSEQEYVYFYYDTFMKLPGMGGGGRCSWVESLPMKGQITAIEGKGPWWDEILVWCMERM